MRRVIPITLLVGAYGAALSVTLFDGDEATRFAAATALVAAN
jgi:hypothetical protein